jgi:CHASE2 domain-containing sensor protein
LQPRDHEQARSTEKLKIFLSYRRSESSGYSGRIYDRLRAALPDAEVFMDVESLEPGLDWRSKLGEQIDRANVMLVLIGAQWRTLADPSGRRRLDDPQDVTRWEIQTALNRGKWVVPVLLEGTSPLSSTELPTALAPLARLQAAEIRHESFDAGLETLIAKLTRTSLRDEMARARGRWLLERAKRWGVPAIGLVVVLLAWTRLFDLLTLDTRMATWTLAVADAVVPVALDETIVVIGISKDHDPFDPQMRAQYATLITQLARARVQAAVLDIHFHASRATDDTLAGAMVAARNSGMRVFVSFVEMLGSKPRSTPALAAAVSGLGLACAGRRLGYAVSVPLAFDVRKTAEGWTAYPLPSLALLGAMGDVRIAAIDGSARTLSLSVEGGSSTQTGFTLLGAELSGKQACSALSPGTRTAELMIRASPLETLRARRLSFDDVVAGRFTSSRLAGKTVVIGFETAEETFRIAHGLRRESRFGYELQADTINVLKSRRITRFVDPLVQTVLSVALAGIGAGLGVRFRNSAGWQTCAIVLSTLIAYVGIAIALAASEDILLNSVYDISAFVFAYVFFRHYSQRRLS